MDGMTRSVASEAIYRHLEEQILHLDLPPGCAISETDTAKQFHVSRTPVRDVFKTLEMEGLLEIQPHVGSFVSLIDLNQISDILYMREALEQAVLKDLSMHFNDIQHLQSKLILEKQKNLLASNLDNISLGREFIKIDNEFHLSLFELAGKKNIWIFLSLFNQQYERFRTFLNQTGREHLYSIYEQHTILLEAISTKDFNQLEKIITKHIYNDFNQSSDFICNYPDYFKKVL